jgi:hypothetical protein
LVFFLDFLIFSYQNLLISRQLPYLVNRYAKLIENRGISIESVDSLGGIQSYSIFAGITLSDIRWSACPVTATASKPVTALTGANSEKGG